MDKNDFFDLCRENNYGERDIVKFVKVVDFIRDILSSRKRFSGDSYFDHNLRVGYILVENKSDPEIVTTGLLHGVFKYVSEDLVAEKFGKDLLPLLREIKEIETLKVSRSQLGAVALRKIILTTMKDVRVILVKLANKLDNMRSVEVFQDKEQKRLAQEVLDIYAPLAYRLGVEKIRVRLEDIAFKIINPRKHKEIIKFLEESREEREKNIEQAIKLIKEGSKDNVVILRIKGRSKHIYSIYRKISKRKVKLNEQYDLLGIRVIVPEIKDCYTILGLLHEKFQPIEGKLKDYISNPKPNFYRSIHTAVKLPNGKIVEIQIRTPEMDEFAEEGLAAHWRYKGVKSDQLFERKIAWLRGVLDLQKSIENKEFLETVKVDLFGDKIYCYTPKGDVKEMPKGSTLLDFAYLIHEEIGNHAIGGRVNGKFVPIKQELKSGDVIGILTNKKQRPRRNWIKIVTSAKARQKIRKSLKEFEKLPALYFRKIKPEVKDEKGVLTHSEEFSNATCVLAKCCLAIPGDKIIGIITKRKIISVHKNDCRQAIKEENRWVPVNCKNTFIQKIKFFVEAEERSGLLADLLHTIVNAGFNVKEAKAKMIGGNSVQCSFIVIPRTLEELKGLIKRVMRVRGVKKIYFD